MEILTLSRTLSSRTVLRSGTAIGLLVALSGPVGHAAAQEGVVAQEQIEEGESVLPAGEAIALDEVLVPLLALGMRLGEGTGAALAAAMVKAAVACHNGMATFAQAGVSDRAAD